MALTTSQIVVMSRVQAFLAQIRARRVFEPYGDTTKQLNTYIDDIQKILKGGL